MRIVMEKYGCTVDWEQESLSAIVKKGDVTVKVPTMQKFIMVNNVIQDTDTKPQNIMVGFICLLLPYLELLVRMCSGMTRVGVLWLIRWSRVASQILIVNNL